ncbi:MAG: hypothetical protein LBL95_04155, partial [Deltaproteobacteria bacterium]|nr:hypothetical protein [Deltaproteobacteria bacterium]
QYKKSDVVLLPGKHLQPRFVQGRLWAILIEDPGHVFLSLGRMFGRRGKASDTFLKARGSDLGHTILGRLRSPIWTRGF